MTLIAPEEMSCPTCLQPRPEGPTAEILAWARKVGADETRKRMLDAIRDCGASDLVYKRIRDAVLKVE